MTDPLRDDERGCVSTPAMVGGLALSARAGGSPKAWVTALTSPPSWTSPEPALPSRGLGFTRWLLAQRAGSLGDVVRGERRYVGTVERIHTAVLIARQPQRLAVERLLEQRAGEARVAGLLTMAQATEDAAERRFGARLQRVLVLAHDFREDRFEFVRRVVGEPDLASEPGAEAGVREQERLHQPGIAGHDHHQAMAVILHPLEQDLYRLGPEVQPAVALRRQRVGLVDEQDAVERPADHAVGLDRGRTDVLPHQSGPVDLHQVALLQQADRPVHLGQEPRDRGLARAGVPQEHQVLGRRRLGQAVRLAAGRYRQR